MIGGSIILFTAVYLSVLASIKYKIELPLVVTGSMSKGLQVKRSTSQKVPSQKVYKSKGPQVKKSTSQKVPSQKVPGQKVYILDKCYFSNQSYQIMWLISGMEVIKKYKFCKLFIT